MIGHDIQAALPRLRREAESMMLDSFTLERPAGIDEDDTGRETTVWEPFWDGPGKRLNPISAEGDAEGVIVGRETITLCFPEGAVAARNGDRATITDSPDPEAVGTRYRIVGAAPSRTFAIETRLKAERITND
jgi:hypothetical protein